MTYQPMKKYVSKKIKSPDTVFRYDAVTADI